MFLDINEKLVKIQELLRKKEKNQVQLNEYEREWESIQETIRQLEKTLQSEEKDVKRLEGISLASLFAALSGTKEEKLAKEKEELVIAQYRLEQATRTLKDIEESKRLIENQLSELGNIENQYEKLLLEKERLVKTSQSPLAKKVLEMSEQEGILQSKMRELDEAIVAGEDVSQLLDEALLALKKAQSWGNIDIFAKGGFITDMVKHQHIDHAEEVIRKAQASIRSFQKELLDVNKTTNIEINISGMLKFADFFFDGFISDFMVQGKISNALNQTRDEYDNVSEIVMKLNLEYNETQKELEKIQKEKREIIEKL
jgi:DNA repair exonuclease SbcCD ATPase subunit